MAYIGNQPGTGVRSRFIYTATASQTTFTGADNNSKTLKYADSAYVDVFLNGVCLVPGTDYTASTKTSIVLTQAASLSDTLEVIAYDIASMDDSISKADGGTFNGDLGITNASPDLTLTNNTTEDTDGGRESTVTFKGLQSGGEESTLAQIQASHDATADDQKGDLIFKTNDGSDGASPTERMRINSDGKTFIGHDTTHQYDAYGDDVKLQLESAGTTPYAGFGMLQNSNDADSAPLIFGKSRGTSIGSTTIVQDADLLGRIEFQGMDGADLETGASIFGVVDGTPGSNDMPGRLVFNTTADGANSATERMRIDSTGSVGINKTDPSDSFLHIAGNTETKQHGINIVFGGVGAGQSSEAYGLKIEAQSNNNASASYGAYIRGSQGVGGNSIGIYGAPHAASLTQNSNAQAIGVFGQCVDNSAALGNSPSNSSFLVKAGVYGLVTQTNSSASSTNTAGHFRNACTTASYSAGLTCSTVAGPTTIRGIEYNHAGADVFRVNSNGNCTNTNGSFGAISDERLKENIADAGSQWDDIKALRVRKYSMKEDSLDAADKIGVIAQELETAGMNGLVENDVQAALQEDGTRDPDTLETTKAVKYSILYMKAVKALQEAMTRIETLETKVTALEAG
jgi:hypothetical protein